jgi:hypothetical protein
MTKVKLISIFLLLFFCTTIGIGISQEGQWYTCMVNEAGILEGGIDVNLTDSKGSFVNTWYSASNVDMLMIALTAMSNGLLVRAHVLQDNTLVGLYLMVEKNEVVGDIANSAT